MDENDLEPGWENLLDGTFEELNEATELARDAFFAKESSDFLKRISDVLLERERSRKLNDLCVRNLVCRINGIEPQKILVELGGLPEELVDLALQERAKIFLKTAFESRGMDFEQFSLFLSCVGGIMFGSCPMAGILGKNWFCDVDVMVPSKTENCQVRWWVKRIFPHQETTENYAPRFMCDHAAEFNRDPQSFEYHRTHRGSRGGSLDVIQAKDIDTLLACGNLDTDRLVFDGDRFYYRGKDREWVNDFVRCSSFQVISTDYPTAFEAFYDPWCMYCAFSQSEGHLTTDYEEVGCLSHLQDRERMGLLETPVGVEKLRLDILKNFTPNELESLLPNWVSTADFQNLGVLRDKVVPRFKELAEERSDFSRAQCLSEYSVVKLFLRLVKLQLRGVSCSNFGLVFSNFPSSHATIERKRMTIHDHLKPKKAPLPGRRGRGGRVG